MDDQARVVLVTAATIDDAARLGRALVEERLAACASIMPGLRSIYRWQDAVQDEAEVLLIIKTTAAALDQLIVRVQALHTYDTPEVLALPVVGGSSTYLAWLYAQVGAQEQS
jgi:periplasmic divalent cation tolerance protein